MIRLTSPLRARAIVARAAEAGVGLLDASFYYLGRAPHNEFVMGYADPVPLDVLRAINGGFMPPQSYMRAPAAIAALAGARKRGSPGVRVGHR